MRIKNLLTEIKIKIKEVYILLNCVENRRMLPSERGHTLPCPFKFCTWLSQFSLYQLIGELITFKKFSCFQFPR